MANPRVPCLLDLLVGRDEVVLEQGRDIADCFMSVCPAN